MRRISAVLLILLSTAGQYAPATAENEPKMITLSCDGTLTGTYCADKPKNMEASQKISVVVDLDDQTVFFLGYVVPIYDVDQASINFGGNIKASREPFATLRCHFTTRSAVARPLS